MGTQEEGSKGEYSVAHREGGSRNQLEATSFKNRENTNLEGFSAQGFEDKWLFHNG